jgi:ABC transport system ATP-binding/permease protein
MARLRVTNGVLAGRAVEVMGEIVIGREDVDLVLDDAEVSRHHATVRRVGRILEVEDLGSSNGTFVDGERIEGPTQVGAGARLRVGDTILAVEGVLPIQATRVRDIQDLGSTPGEDQLLTPIADPQVTRARGVPADLPQATRAREVPSDVTRARPVEAAGTLQTGQPMPPAGAPAVTAGADRPPPVSSPVGAFTPPTRRRKRGLASRSWLPVVLSFATVVVVAVALVIYFATR